MKPKLVSFVGGPGIRAFTFAALARLLALCTFAALTAAPAQAQYPAKPIRIVVGFAPGGGSDSLARAIAPLLAAELQGTVVVENRPGAGGTVATEYVARAAPDGYTLYMATPGALTVAPSVRPLPYDPSKDLQPVARLVIWPLVLYVSADSGIRDVPDLIARARREPGKLNYASSGSGTLVHLCAEYFKLKAGLQIEHVSYKGTAPALNDLMAGQIPMMFSDPSPSAVQSGRVRGIAVTTAKRSALLPDLPTMIEAGVPEFDATVWAGLVGPAGIPVEVTARLDAALARVMAGAGLRAQLASVNTMEVAFMPAAEFGRFLSSETDTWRSVVKRAKITAE